MKDEWEMCEALDAVHDALKLFFRNGFKESKQLCAAESRVSMYHMSGVHMISMCYALFSMEKVGCFGCLLISIINVLPLFKKPLIEEAIQNSNVALAMYEKNRKETTFGSALSGLFKKPDYDSYTDGEINC